MAEISIVIPVYNAQKTLPNCLKSILNQTFKNFEIIAVNDGSTDGSLAELEQYRNKITIINQQNKGAAHARNQGAKISRSPFIIFCDADIIMYPKMLETMIKTLKVNQNASYAYSSFKFGFKNFKLFPFDGEKLRQMPYIHTTSLIRREHFPGFDEKLKRFQDWDLWLTMYKRGYVGHFIPQVLFEVASGGTMSSWLPKFIYRFPFLKKVNAYQAAKKIIQKKHNL
ncbi:MAG: glycosyltransferase family 2 protein [Candidatus Buchananbacteria bacterium]|nr:glycosyltransferase family 2 protein [Candidatus Buchananbacteria bacterium]